MKNLNKLLLAVIMVMTTITASSLDFTEGDLTYSTTSTGTSVYVTGLSPAGKGKSSLGLVIPGKVTHSGTTYRIWGIVDNAFANATNLTSVEMRFGTRIIGEKSFNGCSNITYCRLPSSIYRIDANAFLGCSKLTTVYMAGFNFPLGTVYSSAFPSNSNMYLYISTQSKRSTSEWKARSGFTQFKTVEKSPYAYDVYAVDGGLYSMGYTDEDGASTVRKATLVGYSTNGGETSGGTVYKTHAETLNLTNNLPFRLDTIGSDCFSGQTTLKTIDLTNATNLKYIHMIGPSDAVANVTTLVLPKSSFGFNTSTFDYMTGVAAFMHFNYSMAAIISVLVFIIAFAFSAGPVVWVLCSEIQPLKGRDFGITCSTGANWLSNMAIAATFLPLLSLLGADITMLLYAACSILAIFLIIMYVPETKGVSLEHLEKNLMDGVKLRDIGK